MAAGAVEKTPVLSTLRAAQPLASLGGQPRLLKGVEGGVICIGGGCGLHSTDDSPSPERNQVHGISTGELSLSVSPKQNRRYSFLSIPALSPASSYARLIFWHIICQGKTTLHTRDMSKRQTRPPSSNAVHTVRSYPTTQKGIALATCPTIFSAPPASRPPGETAVRIQDLTQYDGLPIWDEEDGWVHNQWQPHSLCW